MSTLKPPEGNQLADGTYQPSLAPVNFAEASKGAEYFTQLVCRAAVDPQPPRAEPVHPAEPADLHQPDEDDPGNPALPENERDVQFTVNGQFQPEMKSQAGPDGDLGVRQHQRHRLHDTAIHRDGDGQPPEVRHRRAGRQPLHAGAAARRRRRHVRSSIPPGSRYAIAVTMPKTGDLVLDLPPDPDAKGDRRIPACCTRTTAPRTHPPCWATLTDRPQVHRRRRRVLRVPDPDAD